MMSQGNCPLQPQSLYFCTILGNVKELFPFMKAASARGWRCCVLTRRGHGGLGLRTARFSVHGSVEDTRIMVEEVRRQYPSVFIGMVGLSQGGTLLLNYLRKDGDRCPVQAACTLCSPLNSWSGLKSTIRNHPAV